MQNEMFYKGDNVTVPVSVIVSANTIAGNPPQSGDACVIGSMVGVVATTAGTPGAANPDPVSVTPINGLNPVATIAVRTHGVFNLPVHPAAAVVFGQALYIDPATGIISDNAAKTFYGYALAAINAGVTTQTPVKLKH